MIDTSVTNARYQHTPLPGRAVKRPPTNLWQKIALGLVMALATFMNFFLLGQNGYGNLFYAAGVKSMGDSWHNFFFASFDPGGFVTIDKPPLGFWLQVLSTKIFGFTPFSIFFPQALCGVLAVLLLYYLIRRHFGVNAALLAALVLALSPISVATDRNNTIDGTLALVLLLSAWAAIHAAETGKLRWLLLSSVFVGLGFNIKMAEAYLVVPALGLTYFLCAPRKIWVRLLHLLLAVVIMLLISLSWAVAVDLTPASQRPYVGSTQDNSEVSLAFGYNGLNRLHIGDTGSSGAYGGGHNTRTPQQSSAATSQFGRNNSIGSRNAPDPSAGNFGVGAGGRNFGSSSEGPLSLFSASMGGQIGWLLAFALLAILALAWQRRLNLRKDCQQLGLILWGFWLLTMAIFFTFNGSFHQYYMTEMAPGLSAMAGIGLATMWNDYQRPGWRGWLLPFALVLTAAAQINILTGYPAWSWWMSPLIGTLTALVVIALLIFRLKPRLSLESSLPRIATGVITSVGLLALLLAPTIWAGYAVAQNVESSNPQAGPAGQFAQGFGTQRGANAYGAGGTARAQGNMTARFASFMGGGSGQFDPALISYLETNQGQTKFLVATPSSNSADNIILSTNKPVMAMGGFSGGDPILTSSTLQNLIQENTVRFFLLSSPTAMNQLLERYGNMFSGRGGGFGRFGRSALSTWVSGHCSAVPTQDWSSAISKAGAAQTSNQLYDCASLRA
jgi:4-amino-4-deoxy-L-arabinose transferase-like glycosyltransferase